MVLPPQAQGPETQARDLRDPFLDDSYEEHPLLYRWREATPFLADMSPLIVLGVASFLLGAFLHQLWLTTPSSDGLATTAGWLSWLGRAGIGGALVMAAMRPSPASPAIRVAILAVGLLVLLGLVGSRLTATF